MFGNIIIAGVLQGSFGTMVCKSNFNQTMDLLNKMVAENLMRMGVCCIFTWFDIEDVLSWKEKEIIN